MLGSSFRRSVEPCHRLARAAAPPSHTEPEHSASRGEARLSLARSQEIWSQLYQEADAAKIRERLRVLRGNALVRCAPFWMHDLLRALLRGCSHSLHGCLRRECALQAKATGRALTRMNTQHCSSTACAACSTDRGTLL